MQTKTLEDERATARLGLETPAFTIITPTHSLAWSATGGIIAVGSAAVAIDAAAAGGSLVDEAPPLPESLQKAISAIAAPVDVPGPTPALVGAPHEGETPLTWLGRVADVTAIREWVMSMGLSSSAGAQWAAFATAMGWEVEVPQSQTIETTPPGGEEPATHAST